MERNFNQKLKKIIPWLILILAFLIICLFLKKRLNFLIDSDMSSELVLSKLLATEKTFITKNFFYSTELRVLNIHLIFAFFFLFIKSWQTVRFISMIIILLIMLASYYYFCKQINIKKYFAISAVLLLIPFSSSYFGFVLKAGCYVPYIVMSFITLGLIYKYVHSSSKFKNLLLVSASVLALLSGMNGPRQIILLYLPLVLSGATTILLTEYKKNTFKNILKKDSFKFLLSAGIIFLSSVIGYLINTKVFANIYHYQMWEQLSYSTFNINRFFDVINGFFKSFGYTKGPVFSLITLSNMCAIILTFTMIICIINGIKNRGKVSKENYQLSVFLLCSIIVFIIIYCITDLQYADRYNLPIIVIFFPLMILSIKDLKCKTAYKKIIFLIIFLTIILNGTIIYKNVYHEDHTYELRKISKLLNNSDYKAGYSSFWNANVLTELSDGKIDMYDWIDSGADGSYMQNVENVNQMNEWLQLTSHKIEKPKGKVFMLFRSDEINYCVWKEKLSSNNIIYQTDNYIVYGYNSYSSMYKSINRKD